MLFILVDISAYYNLTNMEEYNQDNVVSLVNTYTSSQWQFKKSAEKRRGITRVSKIVSQNKIKSQSKEKPINTIVRFIYRNDENYNNSNRLTHTPAIQQHHLLQDKITHLQHQLSLLVHQNQLLQKQVQQLLLFKQRIIVQNEAQNGKGKGQEQLIESRYLSCKEDIDQWLKQKTSLQNRISNLQLQNDLLKINTGIQEQYILKVQAELDELRKQSQLCVVKNQNEMNQISQLAELDPLGRQIQLNAILKQIEESILRKQIQLNQLNKQSESNVIKKQKQTATFSTQTQPTIQLNCIHSHTNQNNVHFDCSVQCDFSSPRTGQQYQLFCREVQLQTAQFSEVIHRLQEQNNVYKNVNDQLMDKLMNFQNSLKMQHALSNQQNQALKQNIENLRFNQHQLNTIIRNLEQQKYILGQKISCLDKSNCILEQKICHLQQEISTMQQIRCSLEHKLQEQIQINRNSQKLETQRLLNRNLEGQNQQKQHKRQEQLQRDYKQYKQQLDYLLVFLEQQSQLLRQKELRIERQIINNQITSQKLQATLGNPTKIQAIVSRYQERINSIKFSLENYIQQLICHRRAHQRQYQKEQQADQQQFKQYQQSKRIKDLQTQLQEIAKDNAYLLNNQNQLQLQKESKRIKYLQTQLQEIAKDNAYLLNNLNQLQLKKELQHNQLLQVNSQLQIVISSLHKERQSFKQQDIQNKLKMQQQQIKINKLRNEVLYLSQEYQQKIRHCSQVKEQNVNLQEELMAIKGSKEYIQDQIYLIHSNYTTRISQLQKSIKILEGQLYEETKRCLTQKKEWEDKMHSNYTTRISQLQKYIKILEGQLYEETERCLTQKKELEDKMELVKRDYDVLYNKYLKYKNMVILLQPNIKF